MVRDELSKRTATELSAAIRARQVSATDLVEACLEKVEELDASLRAFITICPAPAKSAAAHLDQLASQGTYVGPLHGLPVAIKDLTDTKGIRTTKGSKRFIDRIPDVDDLVVARLKQHGAIVIGKTNTPEFGFGALCANDLAGNTANPYATSYSSGGSSGGSAVAVATGMVPLAHGTDFGGSVRTPASFCNIVGYRPSAGRVPRVPKAILWDTLLSHGVLARCIPDASLMATAISGGDVRDPTGAHASPISSVGLERIRMTDARVAVSLDLGVAEIDTAVADVFGEASRKLGQLFPKMVEAAPDFDGAVAAFETLRAAMLFHDLGPLLDDEKAPLAETVRWNVERGRGITAERYLQAEVARGAIYHRCVEWFENFDVLVTPAASVPPFPLTQENVEQINGRPTRNIIDYLSITFVISLIGLPALSMPAGFTSNGLPVGIQLIGRPGGDAQLLAIAALIEDALSFQHEFPASN